MHSISSSCGFYSPVYLWRKGWGAEPLISRHWWVIETRFLALIWIPFLLPWVSRCTLIDWRFVSSYCAIYLISSGAENDKMTVSFLSISNSCVVAISLSLLQLLPPSLECHSINSEIVDRDILTGRPPRLWCIVWNKHKIELAFFVGAVRGDMITSHDGILNLFTLNRYFEVSHGSYRVSEVSWRRMTPRYTVWCEGKNMMESGGYLAR